MPSKILGQVRPANTSHAVIYTVPANTETTGMVLNIASVDGVDSTYRITQDAAGGTPGNNFAVAWNVPILADTVERVAIGPMNTSGGEVSVRTSGANDLTFTLYGTERLIS